MRRLTLIMVASLLAACSGGDGARLPPQTWGETEVVVETRPAPVRAGMNEFLVIASDPRGRPERDMVVSLRIDPEDQWRQAMQDGGSGVYRKALLVPAGRQILYVHLRRDSGGQQTVLEFPVTAQ